MLLYRPVLGRWPKLTHNGTHQGRNEVRKGGWSGLRRWLASDQEVLISEWCHPPIPMGRNDRGGGGTVWGGTVGAWRPRAGLGTLKSNNRRERWFPSHTPSSSREIPNSRCICAWDMRSRQYAPPLENHWDRDDPWEGHVPGGNLNA